MRAHGTRVCTPTDRVSRRQHVLVACCRLQLASVSQVVRRVSCCMVRATCRRYIMDEDGKWTLSVRASPVVHTRYGPSECTHARTHARVHARTRACLHVPPPPLPLPSAVLAGLHHAGAPGRSCASRASRDASVARCASHDARCPLLMPTCRPCATPPSRIFCRKSIN